MIWTCRNVGAFRLSPLVKNCSSFKTYYVYKFINYFERLKRADVNLCNEVSLRSWSRLLIFYNNEHTVFLFLPIFRSAWMVLSVFQSLSQLRQVDYIPQGALHNLLVTSENLTIFDSSIHFVTKTFSVLAHKWFTPIPFHSDLFLGPNYTFHII